MRLSEARLQTRAWRSGRLAAAAVAVAFAAGPAHAQAAVEDPGDVAAVDVYRESIPTSRGHVVVGGSTAPEASIDRIGPGVTGEPQPQRPAVAPRGPAPPRPEGSREPTLPAEAPRGALDAASDAGTSSPLLRLGGLLAAMTAIAVFVARRSRSV